MAVLKAENWDSGAGVPPATPPGWNVDGVFTTGSPLAPVTPVSTPNVLLLTPIGTSDEFFATWGTPDSSSGDVSVQADFNSSTNTGVTLYGVAARGSSATLDFVSTQFYRGTLDISSGTINIDKVVSGVITNLVSLPFGIGFLNPVEWYQITLTLNGTSISIAAQRLSDNNWVHKIGGTAVFQPGQVIADTAIDGSIVGSGYAGINCRQSGGGSDLLYSDDFLFQSIGTGTPVTYTQSQTFDDVTAPALPSNFSFDSGLVTTATFSRGILPISPPNALVLSNSGVSTMFGATLDTPDASGGEVSVIVYANSPSTTGDQIAGVFARGSDFPLDPISSNYYLGEIDYLASIARLSSVVSGGATIIDSVSISSLESGVWHLMMIQTYGIDIQMFVQRQSDGLWLDPSGNWTSGFFGPALAATDSSVSGSGYMGMTLVSSSDQLYLDSWQSRGSISKTLAVPFYDRVFEGGSCQGINDCLLLGHFSSYQSFAVVGDGNPTGYAITDPVNDAYEIGLGTWHSAGPSLSRNTVAASSNNNQFVNFSPGSKDVFTSISARYIQRTQVTLFDSFVDVENITTTETDLVSNSLPGNTLQFDGDKISAQYAVTLVSSASTKRLRCYFAGSLIHDGLALTTSGAGNVIVDVLIIRDSATSVRYSVSSAAYLASPVTVQSVSSLGSLTLTDPIAILLTGQSAGGAAASGDLTAKLSSVSIVPAAS